MYKVTSRFSWKKLSQSSIILDLEKGEYFTLNDTASLIWEGLAAGRNTESIEHSLMETYVVSEERARMDIRDTIELLVKEGVLEAS